MVADKIFTLNDARKERDTLAENISILVGNFEARVTGVRIECISLTRPTKSDRRGVKTARIQCTVVARLKDGSGFGSDS